MIIGIDSFRNNDRTHRVPGTVLNAGDKLGSVAAVASPWVEPAEKGNALWPGLHLEARQGSWCHTEGAPASHPLSHRVSAFVH